MILLQALSMVITAITNLKFKKYKKYKGIQMKTFTLKKLVAVTAFLTTSIFSQQVTAESSVWKVSKGNDHVYIGGTVHILPASEFPLPQEFTTAYKNTDTIVLETKLPDPTDQAFQAKMMAQVSYKNGKNLADVLTKETYQALSKYVAGFGVDINQLAGFKPGFIVTMMAMMEAKRAQIAGDGVDTYFSQLAEKDKKVPEYLESAEFQIQMLADMGKGNENNFVNLSLSKMGEFKSMFNQLLPAWRTGNAKQMAELVIKPMQKDPETLKALMTDRNKNWIPLIEKMFNDNDKEFILVGVGHLVGEESVIALLKAKGYQIAKI